MAVDRSPRCRFLSSSRLVCVFEDSRLVASRCLKVRPSAYSTIKMKAQSRSRDCRARTLCLVVVASSPLSLPPSPPLSSPPLAQNLPVALKTRDSAPVRVVIAAAAHRRLPLPPSSSLSSVVCRRRGAATAAAATVAQKARAHVALARLHASASSK